MKLFIWMAMVAAAIGSYGNKRPSAVELKQRSSSPVFLKRQSGFEKLSLYGLISSEDVLPESPDYVFGGTADGTGLLLNTDGTFTFLVNHEENFAVSRITLDKTFNPIKGEYLLNSDGGAWRLCSATMATPAEHGFGPLYLSCGESSEESRVQGINPYGDIKDAKVSKELPALGRLTAENAVPLKKGAFEGKTVILIGDDDSGPSGGQLFMYVANKVGDLENGSLYMMKRNDENQREMDMQLDKSYEVSFVKIENHVSLTGAQINAKVDALKAIKFGRVEDIDYRKGSDAYSREIYFNATGQNNIGHNVDASRTKYGRTYKLVLNEKNPLKGTLELVLDGDDRRGVAKEFQNVDNICVTTNYAYIAEDANCYGDETHDAYIYQYNLTTKELKKVLEIDPRRTEIDAQKYNGERPCVLGAWEYGSMIDISEQLGIPNTFILCIQAHTWHDLYFRGVDGGTLRPKQDQGSQIVVLKGLPR